MRSRVALVLVFIAGYLLVAWFLAHPPGSQLPQATRETLANAACPSPPRVTRGEMPLQTPVPAGLALPPLAESTLTPLAGFSVEARVLRRENYYFDAGARFSPTDLALGWGRMRENAVLDQLAISQGSRFFSYRWRDQPPIPPPEIVRSASNMHIIPASEEVASALDAVEAGDNLRIDGWLVRIDREDGWHWVSSLRRDDSGDGACELIYACTITRE